MTDGKAFYQDHHDRIAEKRFDSKYPIRRTVHREIYDSVLQWIRPGERVLDAGCGEGVLSCLMADAGAEVHAVDYSRPNIDAVLTADPGARDPREPHRHRERCALANPPVAVPAE